MPCTVGCGRRDLASVAVEVMVEVECTLVLA